MSTSIADVTCAEVSSERRMCSAIPRRIADIGSSDSPGLRGSDGRRDRRGCAAARGAEPAEPAGALAGGGAGAGSGCGGGCGRRRLRRRAGSR